jgi:hypothetical protein
VFYNDVQTSRICDSPFYLHSDGWALRGVFFLRLNQNSD